MFVLAGAASATSLNVLPIKTGDVGLVERVNELVTGQKIFRYPGSEYVKLHFASTGGGYLTVSTVDGTESHRVDKPGWAMSVTGDTAVVKVHGAGPVAVDQVAHGALSRAHENREESICGTDEKIDVVCYKTSDPVPYRRTKAVARMLIGGVELCTAFRVGPANRLMTNYHCVATPEEAADTEVWFNYQCAECGGYSVFRTTKVWLSQVIASDKTLDYTIFSVSDFATVEKFGYLELDVRRPAQGEGLYVPQHPTGKPAMIAMGNCAVDNPAYEGYAPDTDISYYCDTEGGSSGSPVLSRDTHKVVALHHFGGCPNSGVRMDRIYPHIQGLI